MRAAAAAPAPPAASLAFAHHLAVVLDTERIGAEHERVLSVVERVQEDLDRIGMAEVRIATALGHDQAVGLRVMADDRDVEIRLIDKEPDLG